MGVFHESVAALLQTQAAWPSVSAALEVVLVDEGTPWWQDYVVPGATLIAALVGGIGGVLIGGRMNRNTMQAVEADRAKREARLEADRAEREAGIEADRAEREAQLDSIKAAREETAQRRQALGSLKLLADDLREARINLELEVEEQNDDHPFIIRSIEMEFRVRPEDKHAIAMWVSDGIWRIISITLGRIDLVNLLRARLRDRHEAGDEVDLAQYRSTASRTIDGIDGTLKLIASEADRLESV